MFNSNKSPFNLKSSMKNKIPSKDFRGEDMLFNKKK